MLIKQLFAKERNPTRHLNEVVNAEEVIDVRSEIDEYVFTEHTTAYLRSLTDGILDTSQGHMPETLCCWIAGFFGSGKSHFLKLSAALLENRPLDIDGRRVPALEYLAARQNLALPWERIAREFHVRAVTVNLAMAHGGGRKAQERPLLYRLASEINRAWDYSAVPHVASIEREIKRASKWPAFLDRVSAYTEGADDRDTEGVPYQWTHPDLRDKASDAHRVLEEVLPEVLPKITPARVRTFLKEREDEEQPSPETVVRLALDFASNVHKDMGRVMLCVDEAALYLRGSTGQFDADRVREVQGLAELVQSKGKGKVILLATAQLRVDTIDGAFAGLSGPVVYLRDRFPKAGRLELEERDIDVVVRERWLKKDDAGPHLPGLERLVREHGGLLAHAAKLRDENLLGDVDGLTDAKAVLAYYPCLPYHIKLIQLILSALRQETQIDQTAAQSRALLTSVRSLFVTQNGGNIAEEAIGVLATFDKVYDVVRDVVRKTDSTTDLWIVEAIERLPKAGSVKVSSVAKVIFLLQHLNPKGARRLRVSPENVAALLYPRLGAPWEPHLKDVRVACNVLRDQHYVDEEPDTGLRFYRSDEKTFRGVVDRQPLAANVLADLLRGTLDRESKELGMHTVTAGPGHRLDVRVTVHLGTSSLPDPATVGGRPAELELHLVWPGDGKGPDPVRRAAAQYADLPQIVVWVAGPQHDVDPLAMQALKLEGAINEYEQQHGPQVAELLRGERAKLEKIREELLPRALREAIEAAQVVHAGRTTSLVGSNKKAIEVFREAMSEAVEQVFTQLDDGCVVLDDATLRKVLRWQPPEQRPEPFKRLKLFDASGHPLVDGAFLKELVLAVRGQPEKARTGRAVLEKFRAAPFGWPENAVKAGYAALLRGRRLFVKLPDATTLRSVTDRTEGWLTGTQLFNKSVLEPSDILLSPEEIRFLEHVFARAFEAPGLDTIEKLEKSVERIVRTQLGTAREALAELRAKRLASVVEVEALASLLGRTIEVGLDAGKLKNLVEEVVALTGEEMARLPHGERWNAMIALEPPDRAAQLDAAMTAVEGRSKLVRTIGRLQTAGKLEAVTAIKARVEVVYLPWRLWAAAAPAPPELSALGKQVASDDLFTRADLAIALDARCFEAFAADYRRAHGERHELASAARGRLEEHGAFATASESIKAEILRDLPDCTALADLALSAAPDGRCPACKNNLADLTTMLEVLQHRERVAKNRLDALHTPVATERRGSPGTHAAADFTVRLASIEDLPHVFETMRDRAKGLTAWPVSVRVVFEAPDGDRDLPRGRE